MEYSWIRGWESDCFALVPRLRLGTHGGKAPPCLEPSYEAEPRGRCLPGRAWDAENDLSPEDDNSVNQNNVTFKPNFGSTYTQHDSQLKDIFAANKQSVSSEDFWVIYQLGAFQGVMGEDLDPDYEDWTGYLVGYALSTFFDPNTEAGTVVYAEVVRESEYVSGVEIEPEHLWAAISLHESGHAWGMDDDPEDGPIMNTDLNDVWVAGTAEQRDGLLFSGAALWKVMTADYPR